MTTPRPSPFQPVFDEPWEPRLTELVQADPPPPKLLPALYAQWVGMISRQICRTFPHDKQGYFPCKMCQTYTVQAGDRLFPG